MSSWEQSGPSASVQLGTIGEVIQYVGTQNQYLSRYVLTITKITLRETEREDNTLLPKDKDLSTIQLFCKSVPDDKHSDTQYIKQEYN